MIELHLCVLLGCIRTWYGCNITTYEQNKNYAFNIIYGDDKETVNHAVGDIIGLYDTGNYQIGDTLVGGKQKYSFQDLPQFTPEIFMKVY